MHRRGFLAAVVSALVGRKLLSVDGFASRPAATPRPTLVFNTKRFTLVESPNVRIVTSYEVPTDRCLMRLDYVMHMESIQFAPNAPWVCAVIS